MNWLARDGLSFGKCGRADRKEEDTQREAERGIKGGVGGGGSP